MHHAPQEECGPWHQTYLSAQRGVLSEKFARSAGDAVVTRKIQIAVRAKAYIEKMPSAVSGEAGHNATFAVACKLVNFGLSWNEAWALLMEYNQRCSPPWSERELGHKLDDAFRNAKTSRDLKSRTSRCQVPGIVKTIIDPVTEVESFLQGFRCGEVDLWEASPIHPPDDWTEDAPILLETLYRAGEKINFVTDYKQTAKPNGANKAEPAGVGMTIERDALLLRWRKRMPCSRAGGWLRMNPLDGEGVADVNVIAFRFALVECDGVPIELQISLLAKLPLPIAAILSSGGRSLHAWVRIDAANANEFRRDVSRMLALLAKFGVDGKNKNPARLSRLPGVLRHVGAHDDGRQRLLFLCPQPCQRAIL